MSKETTTPRIISISYKTIEAYAKKIEKQNLKNHNTSLSWGSMLNNVQLHATHHNSDTVEVSENWKNELNVHKK